MFIESVGFTQTKADMVKGPDRQLNSEFMRNTSCRSFLSLSVYKTLTCDMNCENPISQQDTVFLSLILSTWKAKGGWVMSSRPAGLDSENLFQKQVIISPLDSFT